MAQVVTLPVRTDDILILASDWLSGNLWDENVLDKVVRFWHTFLASNVTNSSQRPRHALASMLPEAPSARGQSVATPLQDGIGRRDFQNNLRSERQDSF